MLNFREVTRELASIDRELGLGNRDVPRLFANISLDDFGKLLLHVPSSYPNIRAYFPTMASTDVQQQWTGSSGETLLKLTVAFVRSMLGAYHQFSAGRSHNARILDFGCGYGRILRLMYKYFSDENIFAVDPWDKSINLCLEHKMRGNLALSDWMPRTLPYRGPFDLIYAFSVFTHLSEKTAEVCLNTLRDVISETGILVISIRPEEYWDFHADGKHAPEMKALHAANDFAFLSHGNMTVDRDSTYGDTTMSADYIRRKFSDWQVVGVDWNECDYFQVLVFLQPKKR